MKNLIFVIQLFMVVAWISERSSAQFGAPPVATKEVAGIEPNDVVVECYQKGVKVIIEKARLRRIQSSEKLHFLDPACIAGENETHFIASTSYRACGVSRKVQWNGLVYSNTLMTGFPDTDEFDPRCPVVSIKFTCVHSFFVWPKPRMTRAVAKYINCEHIVVLGPKIKNGIFGRMRAKSSGIRMRSRVLSCPMLIGIGPPVKSGEFARVTVKSKGFKVKRTEAFVCKPLKRNGEYDVQLKAYTDEKFSNEIGRILETPELTIDIFYDLKLNTKDSFLTIYPERCYATPTADRLDKIQYIFIKDGCILDETIQVYSSPSYSYRFSMKSFTFVGIKDAMFFIHCDVSICDAEDKESSCARGCSAKTFRRKRSRTRKISGGFSKKCSFQSIEVAIDRSLLRNAAQGNIHLEDPNCIASVNETHFSFNIKRGKCGTFAKTSGSIVEISNTVYYLAGSGRGFSIPVKCKYTESKVSSSAGRSYKIAHHERFVSIWLGQSYHFNRKIVLDPSVTEIFSDTPLNIAANEIGDVLEVSVSPYNKDLFFVIDHCKIKPSPSSRRKRMLIEHGCAIGDDVLLMKTNMTAKMYFDFQRWRVPGSKLYAKCHFTVCHKNSLSAHCRKRICHNQIAVLSNKRKRRSTDANTIDSSITCKPGKISVAIAKKSLPKIKAADLSLRDSKCGARENDTHIILETKPFECRTSLRSFGSAVEYSNIVLNNPTFVGGIIRRFPTFRLPFKCVFSPFRRRPTTFRTKKTQVNFSGISTGTFSVRLKLFTDPSYDTEMDSINARLSPGSDMYFQVGMESPNSSLTIYLESCYGKPFFSTDSSQRYEFIKDNCPVDDSVLFYRTERTDQKRFSVSPFEFSGSVYKSVFVNCIISACKPNESSSRCLKTCPNSPLPL